MKKTNYKVGHFAEKIALFKLMLKGYRPVKMNYITGRGTGAGEIDLIVLKNKTLVFVEVKKRQNLMTAAEAITSKSQTRIARAAEAFIRKVVVDYEADATEIDNGFFDKIKNLAPYGNSFEEPIIGIQNLVPTEVKTIGADNQHLVLKCGNFDVVSWYGATAIKDGVPASFTVCGRLERDNFGVKLMVDPSDIH